MNRHKSVDDGLAKVPLFAGLTDKELESVRSLMTETNVPAGTTLARQGRTGQEFFVIVSGTASVDRDGEHVADVGPGDFLGEMALLDGGPRNADVSASTEMTLMVVSQRDFSQLLDTVPMIARRMLPTLVKRLRAGTAVHHTH
jgi:CRP/FNR family transcriptional regulator, cyclic AMP receptor protein